MKKLSIDDLLSIDTYKLQQLMSSMTTRQLELLMSAVYVELHERDLNNERN